MLINVHQQQWLFYLLNACRYGWIPGEKEVPDDVQDKYKWVPQVSITHMEILHGAYRLVLITARH